MARSLEDLTWFWEKVIDMKPWKYDHSVNVIPWRRVDLKDKKLKWGVMWTNGMVPPTPACKRALEQTVNFLRADGHDVVDFNPPTPSEAIRLGFHLLCADGGKSILDKLHSGEYIDPGLAELLWWIKAPWIVKAVYRWWLRWWYREEYMAHFLDGLGSKSTYELWKLNVRRTQYRQDFHDSWNAAGLDFLLTVPHPSPAVHEKKAGALLLACGYTFLFNILDYTAGVLAVTRVDPVLDAIPVGAKPPEGRIARAIYDAYVPSEMKDLPVGIQVVGQRLEEEKVLEGMKFVKEAWEKRGHGFHLPGH